MQKSDGPEDIHRPLKFVNVGDLFNEAQEHHKSGNTDLALQMYHAILSKAVGDPMVLYQIGTIHMQKNNPGIAVELLGKVVERKPDFGQAWNHLGICLKKVDHTKSADFAFEQAEKFLPNKPDVPNNRAGMYVNNGTPDKVLEHVERALSLDPNHVGARWHKALAFLEKQDWEHAWEWHEARLDPDSGCDVANRNYMVGADTPWWDGKAKGLVALHGEQGLGDEIMFASCIPDAIKTGAKFVIECNPRLHGLFQRSFPQCEVHGTHKTDGEEWKNGRTVDYKCALGTLPKFFRRKESDFPGTSYLKVDSQKANAYWQQLYAIGDRPKIGITWQGGVQRTRMDLRSIYLPKLAPILSLDADFISLQYHQSAREDIETLYNETGLEVQHWEEAATGQDMDDQAALISQLDLVVSVCQTVVHVSGGVGIPTLVMTPNKPSWRYGFIGNMPWYESVDLVRQASVEWEPTILEVKDKVCSFLKTIDSRTKSSMKQIRITA